MSLKPYLHSASVIAIGSVGFHAASAQQAEAQGMDGYALTVMGGLSNSNFLDDGPSGGADHGMFGAVMLETSLAGYDARLSYSYFSQGDGFGASSAGTTASGGAASADFDIDAEISHMALDGQIFVPSGVNDNLRWIVGARAMQFQQTVGADLDILTTSGGAAFGSYGEGTFRGLGPSVGFQYSTGPIGGSQWGFRGEAVGSLLYGTEEFDATYNSAGTLYSSGGSRSEVVTNVDFSAQADYYLNDSTTLFLQYRTSQIYSFGGGGEQPRANSVILGLTTEF